MTRAETTGEFVAGPKGPVFVLLRRPRAMAHGCVLVVPPFAEEMNKCRRMVTEVALGLTARGIAVVIPDLYGTGDSGGDFGDGDWGGWKADLATAARWGREQGCPVTGILAVRLGCALAEAAISAGAIPPVRRTVLWQPVFDGGRLLSQFLRLRVAASLMNDSKESLAGLRARLTAGEAVDVAGYSLSGRLAADLEAVKIPQRLHAELGDISWLEVAREPGASLPSPSVSLIERTRNMGGHVSAAGFPGEPFWSSTENVVNSEVIRATLSFLSESGQGKGP